MLKADRVLAGARVLLGVQDSEGACSRAYDAMFDAARAALLAAGPEAVGASSKTHRGLIAAFGREFVMSNRLDAEFGRSFNRVQSLRPTADYVGGAPSLDDAADAVEMAARVIEALKAAVLDPP